MFQIDVIVDECVEMRSDMWSDIKNNEVTNGYDTSF